MRKRFWHQPRNSIRLGCRNSTRNKLQGYGDRNQLDRTHHSRESCSLAGGRMKYQSRFITRGFWPGIRKLLSFRVVMNRNNSIARVLEAFADVFIRGHDRREPLSGLAFEL